MDDLMKSKGDKPRTGSVLICKICSEKFYLKPSLVKRSKNLCSNKCRWENSKGHQYNKRHGMRRTRFWRIWQQMKVRSLNINHPAYSRYGGRGIKINNQWQKFENFRDDMYESYLDHVKEFGERETTIDRKNNDGDYCKENCRWSTHKEQCNNRRSNIFLKLNGKTYNLREWSKRTGIKEGTIQSRRRYGWNDERILTVPVRQQKNLNS